MSLSSCSCFQLSHLNSPFSFSLPASLPTGTGESQLQLDKRIIKDQVRSLRTKLDSVRTHRNNYRAKRASTGIPVVALVGYTNAGKSTLMNRMAGSAVLAEDKLFATLDPTSRRLVLPKGKDILVTDTVGFIQALPTQLVASFRATLEEIQEASLILHVVDASHPNWDKQMAAVHKVRRDGLWRRVVHGAEPCAAPCTQCPHARARRVRTRTTHSEGQSGGRPHSTLRVRGLSSTFPRRVRRCSRRWTSSGISRW